MKPVPTNHAQETQRALVVRVTQPTYANRTHLSTFGNGGHQQNKRSFGMTMVEIWQKGTRPYNTLTNDEVAVKVARGYRHTKPPSMNNDLYTHAVLPCFTKEATQRPTFSALFGILANLRSAAAAIPANLNESDKKSRPISAYEYTPRSEIEAGRKIPLSNQESARGH